MHYSHRGSRDTLKAMGLPSKNLRWEQQRLYVIDRCNKVHVAQMFPSLYQECLQEAAILLNRLELERKRLIHPDQWGPGLSSENADFPILVRLLRLGFTLQRA
ncbi:hypothetical protein [Gloeobacter kilaueensis]|uniref:Uncharacterized protein n=1 Tax=Gloeobacter kilaueensis (strain ATCC BAA-2537 / CCAP 1431/1 / ULC 316 / JS1) TaxID=1183438 RepID=U5QNW6_GLOK1|nr:hypothetical protein [Gloeobacter kilaueensis]AGY59289.1 hypothetical protein GKIL_3043 [Gloeobacter kilaueensis JS1]